MWLPSTTAVCQSSRPAWLSRHSSSRCSAANTPAACHSLSRRCAVAGERPSSRGRCCQAIPVNSTKTIAPKQTRSSTRGRPPRGSGSWTGTNGCTTSHNSSRTRQIDAAKRPPPRRDYVYPPRFAAPTPSPPAEVLRQLLSADDRLIVSEPFSDLPGVWREIPEATAVTVRVGGLLEERPFRVPTLSVS